MKVGVRGFRVVWWSGGRHNFSAVQLLTMSCMLSWTCYELHSAQVSSLAGSFGRNICKGCSLQDTGNGHQVSVDKIRFVFKLVYTDGEMITVSPRWLFIICCRYPQGLGPMLHSASLHIAVK